MEKPELTPFPLLFGEPSVAVEVGGTYDDVTQMRTHPNDLSASTTFVETATGGHGDTDNDTDQD